MFQNLLKYILISIVTVSSLLAYASNDIDFKAKADSAMYFHNSGEYYRCIDIAQSVSEGYPFWGLDKQYYHQALAYGAISIHALQLSYDSKAKGLDMQKFMWGADACNYFDGKLRTELKYLHTSQSVIDYFTLLELATSTYGCIADMTEGITKRYDKMVNKWKKSAYKSTFKNRHQWYVNPFARLYILENAITVLSEKNLFIR